MKVVGVIGYPLGHSLSPVFQQAAFTVMGLDIRYERWETPPERLHEVVASLRGPHYLGANVTVPYKVEVMPMLDELDEVALQAGAVNTIVNRHGRLLGYNTDVAGFTQALREAGCKIKGVRALILGAGGAARAAALALTKEGAAMVVVTNRTYHRAFQLAESLRPMAHHTVVRAIPLTYAALQQAGPVWDLIVNATTLGMPSGPEADKSPLPSELIPQKALVFDMVYGPTPTPLLKAAMERGARGVDGLAMLIYQGAESFRLWTGLEPPLQVMMAAAKEALRLPTSHG